MCLSIRGPDKLQIGEIQNTSVADPDVFGPSVSGSVITSYHKAKIVRKIFFPTVLRPLYDFLFLKNYANVDSKSNKQRNLEKKSFLVSVFKVTDENRRMRIR